MTDHLSLDELRSRVKEFATPSNSRAFFEVGLTLALFFSFLVFTSFVAKYSTTLAVLMGLPSGLLLVRLFVLQHDCGHRSFFKAEILNRWCGRFLSTMCMTPYEGWRRSHLTHHRHTGQLDVKRGEGNIWLYTTEEFAREGKLMRFLYRAYHNPLILHVIGPVFLFVLYYRFWWVEKDPRARNSMLSTNGALLLALLIGLYSLGWYTLTVLFVPTICVASIVGAWAFYTQHTFPNAYFAHDDTFDKRRAIILGCSYLKLPQVLNWLTAWIGYHSLHHLNPSIPSYRLRACWKKCSAHFADTPTFTLLQTLKLPGLALWDNGRQQMVRIDTHTA